MTDADLARLSPAVADVIRDAARQALLPRFRSADLRVDDKGGGELVTDADHHSEAILTTGLSALLPGAVVLGEEAAAANPTDLGLASAPLAWIVDPLDGTANFAAGDPRFGIMVALAAGGDTLASWIYQPLTGRLCHARAGAGAWIDDAPVAARTAANAPPTIGLSSLWRDGPARAAIEAQLADRYRFVPLLRCAAEVYPMILLGGIDGVRFERTLAWDHAAGVLLVEEAGAVARRPDGSAYRPDSQRNGLIVASDAALWASLAADLETAVSA